VSVGGEDYKRMTFEVMSTLLSKEISMLYSMLGRKGKKAFKPLKLYNCVISKCLQIYTWNNNWFALESLADTDRSLNTESILSRHKI
jgi:hypothetical protein